MTKKNDAQINFALTAIKTEQFAIFEENFEPKNESGFSTELQFKLNHINKQIGVFLGFEFFQGEKMFLKIQVSCHFKIQEQSWENFIQENKSDIVVPKAFMAHLAMITTGTARGVLFAKTESTCFAKFIVPTINVSDMIPEDAVFKIENE